MRLIEGWSIKIENTTQTTIMEIKYCLQYLNFKYKSAINGYSK